MWLALTFASPRNISVARWANDPGPDDPKFILSPLLLRRAMSSFALVAGTFAFTASTIGIVASMLTGVKSLVTSNGNPFITVGRTTRLFVITASVSSVGAARATARSPSSPEAPAMFSTMTGTPPRAADRPGWSARAVASVAEPALVGTISRTTFEPCARAAGAATAEASIARVCLRVSAMESPSALDRANIYVSPDRGIEVCCQTRRLEQRMEAGLPGRDGSSKGLPRARVGQLAAVRPRGEDDLLELVRLVAEAQRRAEPDFRVMQSVGTAHDSEKHQAPVFQAQVGVAPEQAKVMALEHPLVRV